MYSKKYLILTANIGERDILRDPQFQYRDCDYIAITDRHYESCSVWDQRQHECLFFDEGIYNERMVARAYKINPFQFHSQLKLHKYEYLIWKDSNVDLNIHPSRYIDLYKNKNCYAYFVKHPWNETLKDEISEIDYIKCEYPHKTRSISKFIDQLNWKNQIQMIHSAFFIRDLKFKNFGFDQLWWQLLCKYSSRDQLTLPIAIKKSNITYDILDVNIYDSEIFKVTPHTK